MGGLRGFRGQGFVVVGLGGIRVQGQGELVVPAELETRLTHSVVPVAGARVALRHVGRVRGDLVVELFVETPTELTVRQKELMQELAQSFGEAQNPRNSSFAGKAKRFWADILGNQDADGSRENA